MFYIEFILHRSQIRIRVPSFFSTEYKTEKQGGTVRWQMFDNDFGPMATDVCLSCCHLLFLNIFPFPSSIAQLIGVFCVNMRSGKNYLVQVRFSFLNY
jgi:hypothetical protein